MDPIPWRPRTSNCSFYYCSSYSLARRTSHQIKAETHARTYWNGCIRPRVFSLCELVLLAGIANEYPSRKDNNGTPGAAVPSNTFYDRFFYEVYGRRRELVDRRSYS